MNDKKMEKIDEKDEEKVSGGIRLKKGVKVKNILMAQGYGAVALTPILNNKVIPYKTKSEEIGVLKPKSKSNDTSKIPQPQIEDAKMEKQK